VSHPDSLARLPIDPAMGNSFGSYSEPGTRNSFEAETSSIVRDHNDQRRRAIEALEAHAPQTVWRLWLIVYRTELKVSLCA